MLDFGAADEIQSWEKREPFSFTKGCPVMQIPGSPDRVPHTAHELGHLLCDPESDPGQAHALDDPEREQAMIRQMVRLMEENDAPAEQYERLGL